jgi:hypothetical protein
MDAPLERGEKATVQVFAPVGRQDRVVRRFGGKAMGEVVHLGVRDVPSLMDGGATPPSGFGSEHLQGRPHPHKAFHRALTVPTGGLEQALNASETIQGFATLSFAHGARHPERLTARQASVALLEHGSHFWTIGGHDEVGGGALPQERCQ